MISFNLTGKAALVTGGASGIGLATAHIMAKAGAKVAINFLPADQRGEAALAQFQKEGLNVIGAPGDVGDAGQAEAMVLEAVATLGRLDLLVNNAGIPGVKVPVPINDLDGITEELWASLLNVNLMSVFRCSKAAAPALKAAKGAIVNTASIAGFGAVASTIAYSGSKAAVINLTKNLARALAPDVRVNAVAPGVVESSWGIEWSEERRLSTIANTPLKKVCTTADVAQLIVYLGFAGALITGQTVAIDGGISI
ncbi:SDR family NAD(P)-dependent oxidoreductase [Methylovirgula sp. 4M-Z18]|uniref:SDR family NAD(P)-dependent oxidoreductase n=1 Tax=Methylovirgula sp. 4M-Z18 TaxID=2293567 RepID=UPI000E2EEDDC|nr:SDR family NAD(P)-dependent oxidoreductase [Methylovirgula sp. 4M-Z18]RFB76556.1 SDR family NAD(P)-dependent oxidoreductase [Methylovirgula sp. 4M-Z18]